MIWKPLVSLVICLWCSGVAFAQWGASPEKSAARNIEKGRWQKAESSLRKVLAKQSVNPSARYVLSLYYFRRDNPAFHLDSAYHQVVMALADYERSPSRDRERLRRAGADSLALIALRARIDSTAFEVARATNTEAAYIEFLSHFPSAVQRDLAAQLRDEVAFQEALNENTHRAFKEYLARYPEAKKAPDARAHYHRLLYTEETRDQRLSSFERFLSDYPESPYRREVYKNIFEISTADGSVESLLAFMTRYPVSDLVKKARQMIFHILAEQDEPLWPGQFLNDSLRNLLRLNTIYLVPFLKNGQYGFMDERAREIIPPRYKNIHSGYLCGHITEEILLLENNLVARNGSVIYRGPVSGYEDLGRGLLKVTTPQAVKVIHKAGFVVADSVEDARITGKSFVALKRNGSWYIHSLVGKMLDPRPWSEISSFENLLIFSSGEKKHVATAAQLVKSADGLPLVLSEPFNEVKPWPKGLVWGKAGEYQGVLDQSLQGVIRFDRHELTQTAFGAIGKLPNGFTLFNWSGKRSSTFDQVAILGDRIAVKQRSAWYFLDSLTQETTSGAFDSLRAEGPFIIGHRGDSATVWFQDNRTQSFYRPQRITFVPGINVNSFLVVETTAERKSVFDLKGNRLFSGSFDGLEYGGKGVFVITRKNRKGLVAADGDKLLPAEFDAMGSSKDGVVSVLRNKRFGAYHIGSRKLIKPQFERNLVPYNSDVVVTYRNGLYGFLGWDNKPVSDFEFDEITYWSDSLALVRKGSYWNLYDLTSGAMSESNLRSVSFIRDEPGEKLAIIGKDNSFGVVSSRGRVIIPLTFSAVVNLGSPESPMYFTEKHIEEASLYVVIYYDQSGNMLRKEIYDDAGDYDRIYCSDQ